MSARSFIALDTLGKRITNRCLISFGIAWLAVIIVVLLALWAISGRSGLNAVGDAALLLGINFTSGLGQTSICRPSVRRSTQFHEKGDKMKSG